MFQYLSRERPVQPLGKMLKQCVYFPLRAIPVKSIVSAKKFNKSFAVPMTSFNLSDWKIVPSRNDFIHQMTVTHIG
jgi:hypothetical protein